MAAAASAPASRASMNGSSALKSILRTCLRLLTIDRYKGHVCNESVARDMQILKTNALASPSRKREIGTYLPPPRRAEGLEQPHHREPLAPQGHRVGRRLEEVRAHERAVVGFRGVADDRAGLHL